MVLPSRCPPLSPTPPRRCWFHSTLPMTGGVLNFAETMDLATFNPTYVTIEHARSASQRSFTLSSLTGVSATKSPRVILTVSACVLASIRALASPGPAGTLGTGLARGISSTFLSIRQQFVRDMAGNAAVAISAGRALQATRHTADLTPPVISSSALDMSLGLLRLTFAELVDISTFSVQSVTLQNTQFDSLQLLIQNKVRNPTSSYTLTSLPSSSATYSPVVSLVLATADLHNIKRIPGLAKSSATTFLATVEEYDATLQ
eukprot:m.918097 g.918097  ORF g.918097 m.918097 type:complete len:261 (+) comp60173_c0_seq1:1431-2213(+)